MKLSDAGNLKFFAVRHTTLGWFMGEGSPSVKRSKHLTTMNSCSQIVANGLKKALVGLATKSGGIESTILIRYRISRLEMRLYLMISYSSLPIVKWKFT